MIQLTPHMKVRLHVGRTDFRNGIDGLVRMCREVLQADPFSGTMFLFKNRSSTSVKILVYDSQGFWLFQKRLSEGKFRYWPKDNVTASELTAQEISVLLFNGDPRSSRMAAPWRKVG